MTMSCRGFGFLGAIFNTRMPTESAVHFEPEISDCCDGGNSEATFLGIGSFPHHLVISPGRSLTLDRSTPPSSAQSVHRNGKAERSMAIQKRLKRACERDQRLLGSVHRKLQWNTYRSKQRVFDHALLDSARRHLYELLIPIKRPAA